VWPREHNNIPSHHDNWRKQAEKLLTGKIAKIRSRQDALETILSGRLDIFYLQILAVFDGKGVFQQPQAFTPTIPNGFMR